MKNTESIAYEILDEIQKNKKYTNLSQKIELLDKNKREEIIRDLRGQIMVSAEICKNTRVSSKMSAEKIFGILENAVEKEYESIPLENQSSTNDSIPDPETAH